MKYMISLCFQTHSSQLKARHHYALKVSLTHDTIMTFATFMRLLRDTRRRYCCGSVKHDSVDVFTVKPSAVINTEDVGPKYYEFKSKELFSRTPCCCLATQPSPGNKKVVSSVRARMIFRKKSLAFKNH